MPFISVEVTENHKVGLWKITESLPDLMLLFAKIPDITAQHEGRSFHTLASRLTLMHLLDTHFIDLHKTEAGKPFVNGRSEHISLSHSGTYASAIVSNSDSTGIDIERMDERIFRIAHKFVNETEKEQLHPQDMLGHYLLWNIKESLFKFYGRGAVDFRKHLQVDLSTRSNGYCRATLNKHDLTATMEFKYQVIEDQYLLTWINHNKPMEIYASHSK